MPTPADTNPTHPRPTGEMPRMRPGLWPSIITIARDIKLAHSVFALPFALLASVMALHTAHARSGEGLHNLPHRSPSRIALVLAIIIACMVLARTFAMIVNRVADREIDAQNLRTKRRAFASGALPPVVGYLGAGACALIFVACAAFFGWEQGNWLPAILSLPLLAFLAFYSFTKRFTALCHLVLGACLAASPLCAALALAPATLTPSSPAHLPALWLLAGFVLAWVAGFDVIYALQDELYDKSVGLSSIPAALGVRGSVWVSRSLHTLGFVFLVLAWRADARFGLWMLAGVVLVGLLLLIEHASLTRLARVSLADPTNQPPAFNLTFFTINGVVSCMIGTLGIIDVLV